LELGTGCDVRSQPSDTGQVSPEYAEQSSFGAPSHSIHEQPAAPCALHAVSLFCDGQTLRQPSDVQVHTCRESAEPSDAVSWLHDGSSFMALQGELHEVAEPLHVFGSHVEPGTSQPFRQTAFTVLQPRTLVHSVASRSEHVPVKSPTQL
jgi:hypothetical protein